MRRIRGRREDRTNNVNKKIKRGMKRCEEKKG
jgi:hypothetical protein